MSQNNKALIGRYLDELNRNNTAIIEELFAGDGKVYSAAGGDVNRTHEASPIILRSAYMITQCPRA